MWKVAKYTLITVGIGLAAFAAYLNPLWQAVESADDSTSSPPRIVVEAALVRIGVLSRQIATIGSLRSDESIVVRPELSGRVSEIGFEEGQPVDRGRLLVTLDGSIYAAELQQAEARLVLSEANFERAKELHDRGSASPRARDEALANLGMDGASVALAKARLKKTRIRSPHKGIVGLRKIGVGDYVSPGDDLVTLDVVDPIKLVFRVPEIYLASVSEGQAIEFYVDALPGEPFQGVVYAIDPQVDINGRSLKILAKAGNADRRLKPGLFARISLFLAEKKGTLFVPEEAVAPSGNTHFLYRVIDGKAVRTPIVIGARQGQEVEVLRGVSFGDLIVTAGHLKLRDGVAVSIRNDPSASRLIRFEGSE